MAIFLLMAVVGIGWGAIVSLPFAIMSQRVRQREMGLYMGLFNLSVVLPQLVVSLLSCCRLPSTNLGNANVCRLRCASTRHRSRTS